ncbi:MAG: hypothetical protein JW825_03610 [Candidatus Methanofastidiosa archaeon]|nr:hypothetical protein [Candidatus Methanofastidiosa archaeon]
MSKEDMLMTYYSLSEDERQAIDRQAIELLAPLFVICERNDDSKESVLKICACSNVWKKVLRHQGGDS